MGVEQETKVDKLRRFLSYISIGLIGIGAVIGSSVLVAGALFDIAGDESLGKSFSDFLKNRKNKKSQS